MTMLIRIGGRGWGWLREQGLQSKRCSERGQQWKAPCPCQSGLRKGMWLERTGPSYKGLDIESRVSSTRDESRGGSNGRHHALSEWPPQGDATGADWPADSLHWVQYSPVLADDASEVQLEQELYVMTSCRWVLAYHLHAWSLLLAVLSVPVKWTDHQSLCSSIYTCARLPYLCMCRSSCLHHCSACIPCDSLSLHHGRCKKYWMCF